jgi:hypothetical protein
MWVTDIPRTIQASRLSCTCTGKALKREGRFLPCQCQLHRGSFSFRYGYCGIRSVHGSVVPWAWAYLLVVAAIIIFLQCGNRWHIDIAQ